MVNYDTSRQYLNFNWTCFRHSSLFGVTWPSDDLWQTNFSAYEESTGNPIQSLFLFLIFLLLLLMTGSGYRRNLCRHNSWQVGSEASAVGGWFCYWPWHSTRTHPRDFRGFRQLVSGRSLMLGILCLRCHLPSEVCTKIKVTKQTLLMMKFDKFTRNFGVARSETLFMIIHQANRGEWAYNWMKTGKLTSQMAVAVLITNHNLTGSCWT